MPTLARFLSVHLQGTVVDRTGLAGRYAFHLNSLLSKTSDVKNQALL
jgi:uncharacterized protein (TIGR03435 family)